MRGRGNRCRPATSRAVRTPPLHAVVLGRGKQHVGSSGSSSGSSSSSSSSSEYTGDDGVGPPSAATTTTTTSQVAAQQRRYGFDDGHSMRHSTPAATNGYSSALGGVGTESGADSATRAAIRSPPPIAQGSSKKISTSVGSSSTSVDITGINGDPTQTSALSSALNQGGHADSQISVDVTIPDTAQEKTLSEQGAVVAAPTGTPAEPASLFAGDVERASERAASMAAASEQEVSGATDAQAGAAPVAATTSAVAMEQERSDAVGAGRDQRGGDTVLFGVGKRWRKRITFVARTVQIWAFLFHVLIKLFRQKLVQGDEVRMSARRRKLGRYLCRAFLKLGPTFIKIGQVRSGVLRMRGVPYGIVVSVLCARHFSVSNTPRQVLYFALALPIIGEKGKISWKSEGLCWRVTNHVSRGFGLADDNSAG